MSTLTQLKLFEAESQPEPSVPETNVPAIARRQTRKTIVERFPDAGLAQEDILSMQHTVQAARAIYAQRVARREFFMRDIPDITDHWDDIEYRIWSLARRTNQATMTILAHGAGVQTSILFALASRRKYFPGIDLAVFSDVGDFGTPCEWPETLDFIEKLYWFCGGAIPLYKSIPSDWNSSVRRFAEQTEIFGSIQNAPYGLFDQFSTRKTIPFRAYRGCSDHYKISPQLQILESMHEYAARLGLELSFRQIMGFTGDEKHRALRFKPGLPYISGWFPMIELGWTREHLIGLYAAELPQMAATIGHPAKSGCWFCPFQKRGRRDRVTMEAQPRSWLELRDRYPALLEAAIMMEQRNNARRQEDGKEPAYLYGNKPLTYWMAPERLAVQTVLFEKEEGEDSFDDLCTSGYCIL